MSKPTYHQTTEGEMGFMERCNGTVSHWTPDWYEYDYNAHECDCSECTYEDNVHVKQDLAIPEWHEAIVRHPHNTGVCSCTACGRDWFDLASALLKCYDPKSLAAALGVSQPYRYLIDKGAFGEESYGKIERQSE